MGDCNACIYTAADGLNPNELELSVTRTARREHTCCECRKVIQRGVKYQRDVIVNGGNFHTFTTCTLCVEIRETFCCDGWVFGTLWRDARESFLPNMNTACLDRLTTAAAKSFLQARWWDYMSSLKGPQQNRTR